MTQHDAKTCRYAASRLALALVVSVFFVSTAHADTEKNQNDVVKSVDSNPGIITNLLSKKEPILSLNIADDEYAINPYFGIGYEFSIASYTGSANYNKYIPTIFHDAIIVVGTQIGSNLLVELRGMAGGNSTTNHATANLNSVHINVGWSFGEELLGEYGDKNKIIVLAGLALGITNASVDGIGSVASNYVSVAPEISIGYQRYLADRVSIRFDARMSSAKIYNSNGSIIGQFVGTIMFHL